ncbi:hypothetical protein HOR75_gp54 [Shewanella phage SppYZU05]|uniref:Uncharacterized protein n=1 Tax=Shewanella phage SppYZU05 TaxID=1970795 RepID=A0A1W6JTK1_9CAUD|nr:hypothetical protein HOR75_gp54 [Shewanella phage SppYZU05]ARM70580.1 hypothetical protein SppYZU05_54 [Shewanella phage SppYZU05]
MENSMNSRQRSYYLRAKRIMKFLKTLPTLPTTATEWYPAHVRQARARLKCLESAQNCFVACGKNHDAELLAPAIRNVTKRINIALEEIEIRKKRDAEMLHARVQKVRLRRVPAQAGTVAFAGSGIDQNLFATIV